MKQLFFCTGKRTVAPTFTATPTLSAVAFVVGNTVTCNASYTGVVSGVVYFNSSPNYDSLRPSLEYLKVDLLQMVNSFKWK